jgi:hypothetical protein
MLALSLPALKNAITIRKDHKQTSPPGPLPRRPGGHKDRDFYRRLLVEDGGARYHFPKREFLGQVFKFVLNKLESIIPKQKMDWRILCFCYSHQNLRGFVRIARLSPDCW